MRDCRICKEPTRLIYCSHHREHLNNFEGLDYSREIIRQMKGNKCESCQKVWEEGMRRFDVHHLNSCGKFSRTYDRLADILSNITEYLVLCHRCHYRHPTHTLNKN